eukprot:Filipodium_phascolosomae@DN3558_c0_g1_i1.p1
MAKVKAEEVDTSLHRVRITMTSTNLKAVEEVATELVSAAKKQSIQVRGPARMPTKRLKITARKSPCGEGTNTYDRWEMRIHKRWIDLHSGTDDVKKITQVNIQPGVDVEVTVL